MSSAFRMVIGLGSGIFFMRCCFTSRQLMKEPVAPLSTNALHWTLRFAFFDLSCMGIVSDFKFLVVCTNTSSGKHALVQSHIARLEPFKNLNRQLCLQLQSNRQLGGIEGSF